MNWSDFFHMGGYALYVWTSYGIAFVILIINVIVPIVRKQRLLRELQRLKSRKAS